MKLYKYLSLIHILFGKDNSEFDEKRTKALQQQLYIYASDLQKTASLFMQMLSMFMDDIKLLNKEETLTYLHSQVSPYTQKISGNYDDFLSYYLCDSSFIGGAVPSLGDYYFCLLYTSALKQDGNVKNNV